MRYENNKTVRNANNKFIIKNIISRNKYSWFISEYLFFIIFVVLLMPIINAHFVCGKVIDSEKMSAQWFDVRAFYPYDSKYSYCEVSPAENKYCCDVESILGRAWEIGDIIMAEIYDPSSGYAAGPVSVVTTGEGYDILPEMQLEKVIRIHNHSKLVFSNSSEFLLNASFREPYNFIELEKDNSKSVICENCTNIFKIINGSFGMNYLKLYASYGNKNFSENLDTAILDGFDFNRELYCEKCIGNRVKANQEVSMKLMVNLSHEINDLELKEYVPVEWEIIDTDGEVRSYSKTHNMIIWNISGKNIIKEYKVKSPNLWFFPRKYFFRTELENTVISEDLIKVYRFFWFLGFEGNRVSRELQNRIYSRILPGRPLVIKPNNSEIIRMGIFPKKRIRNSEFGLVEGGDVDLDDYEEINFYLFDTNLNKEDIKMIYIEFKIQKDINASMFVFNKDFKKSEIEVFKEDEEFYYYNSTIGSAKGIAFLSYEPGWF
ncbi:hypothetical protein GF386_06795 [Candidatus Pacearchaeota archaeon]|nr:hypothetical protein [Candidatus Pacearchaeota archaeon]